MKKTFNVRSRIADCSRPIEGQFWCRGPAPMVKDGVKLIHFAGRAKLYNYPEGVIGV